MDSSDLYRISEELRKESRSTYNRLRSIDADAQFVTDVSQMFPGFPVIGNERCGVWYVDPQIAHADSVYFKSTDGHTGNWKFSLRRANTHVFAALARHGGCLIVDSTRKGKSMPDSFSRTIPVWCAVWNTAIRMVRGVEWDCALHTPPSMVSESESSQMQELVPRFVQSLLESGMDIGELTGSVGKPLRPIWVTRDQRLAMPPDFGDADFVPVVCVSASSTRDCGQGFMYVQGAADDHELWAGELTAQLYWQHRAELLRDRNECLAVVKRITQQCVQSNGSTGFSFIRTTNVAVGGQASGQPPACWTHFDAIINCRAPELAVDAEHAKRYLYMPITDSKRGQSEMAGAIPRALEFVRPFVSSNARVLVHCAQGSNLSVCVALAILVQYFDAQGEFRINARSEVTKQMIQKRLLWITTAYAKANPQRAMLKQVFERALGMMQSEWRRVELERMEWEVERVRLKARISASEKRIAQLSTLYTVSQKHITMLEKMLGSNGNNSNSANSSEPVDVAVSEVVEVTQSTRERSRRLLEQCLEEIEALANGKVDLQPPEIAAAPLEALRRGEFGAGGSSAASLGLLASKASAQPKLNGIIESEPAGEPAPSMASTAQLAEPASEDAAHASDDEGSQPERRPIRRISEQRRQRRASSAGALTVDEVDTNGAPWREQRVLAGHMDCVRAVDTRGDVAASGGDDGVVAVWALEAARPRRPGARDAGPTAMLRGHLSAVTSVTVGAEHVYAGGLDSSIRAWALPAAGGACGDDVAGVFPAREYAGHTDAVWGLALAPHASLLASVSADATCRLWSTDAQQTPAAPRATLRGAHCPTALCFARDGGGDARLAVGYASGLVDVRDLGAASSAVAFHAGSRVTRVAQQGALLAVACAGGAVQVYDARTGASVLGSSGILAYPAAGVAATAVDIADPFLVTGGSDGAVKWWDWRRPQRSVCEVGSAHAQKADEGVCAVRFAAGSDVLTAGADGLVRLFSNAS
ncbi:tRNA A64-2'-O-ribosylphosphate transferase [Coemansia sp. RSA 2705]|nr:tRNA A64-2'-O-ribosylphosphate transferase [Coemansia sp. RSA 2705]